MVRGKLCDTWGRISPRLTRSLIISILGTLLSMMMVITIIMIMMMITVPDGGL